MALQPSNRWQPHQRLSLLLDNFVNEELQQERAVEELKRKRRDLTSKVEVARSDLARLKENRIAAAAKAHGRRCELKALGIAVSLKQANVLHRKEEISKGAAQTKQVAVDVGFNFCDPCVNIKEDLRCMRDKFIAAMIEINEELRTMQSAHCTALGSPVEAKRQKLSHDENFRMTNMDEELVSKVLSEIASKETTLDALSASLSAQNEKVCQVKNRHSEHQNLVSQAAKDLDCTRNQSLALNDKVTALAAKLQDSYICSTCGADNIAQATS